MKEPELNLDFTDTRSGDKTCKTCIHRQRWQCGGSIIQYCAARPSNRTFNHLLKIKAKNPACYAYKEVQL